MSLNFERKLEKHRKKASAKYSNPEPPHQHAAQMEMPFGGKEIVNLNNLNSALFT